jgi:hypothetical protein
MTDPYQRAREQAEALMKSPTRGRGAGPDVLDGLVRGPADRTRDP